MRRGEAAVGKGVVDRASLWVAAGELVVVGKSGHVVSFLLKVVGISILAELERARRKERHSMHFPVPYI